MIIGQGKSLTQAIRLIVLYTAGGDNEYACLEVGMLNLKKHPDFLPYLEAWNWIDENDPDESTDLLKLFTKKL